MKIKGTDQYGLTYTTEDVRFLITLAFYQFTQF